MPAPPEHPSLTHAGSQIAGENGPGDGPNRSESHEQAEAGRVETQPLPRPVGGQGWQGSVPARKTAPAVHQQPGPASRHPCGYRVARPAAQIKLWPGFEAQFRGLPGPDPSGEADRPRRR